MKKVKLNQIMASPKGCFPSGSIIEMSDSEADYLVSIHQAIILDEVKVEKKEKVADKVEEKETADLKIKLKEGKPKFVEVTNEHTPEGYREFEKKDVPEDLDPNN